MGILSKKDAALILDPLADHRRIRSVNCNGRIGTVCYGNGKCSDLFNEKHYSI